MSRNRTLMPDESLPELGVLFGQPDQYSTSFQTTQLARALGRFSRVTELRVPASPAPSLQRFWANYLRPLISRRRFDSVLYANDGCVDLRRWDGRKLLYWYDAPADWSRDLPVRWVDRLRCRNVVTADHVFAVSAAQIGVARRLRPGRESSVHYLPVGVDCTRFDPALANPGRVRERWSLPATFIVGYLGFLGFWQGRFAGEPLIPAAQELLRRSNVHFLIVGAGPAFEIFKSRVHQAGLSTRFTFTGRVPDDWVPDCIAAMDVCVDILEPGFHSEARSETKLKQYMAMGRACVATDIGENRTDLDSGHCGVLVPPGEQGLTEGILNLSKDPERRSTLGALARQRARDRYDWSLLAKEMAVRAGWFQGTARNS